MVPTVTKVEQVEVVETKATVDVPKKERGRNWTDMEVNLFAAILVDENYNFALSLENLAVKKSSNKEVLTHIKAVFDQALEEAEFKGTTLNKYFPGEDGLDNFEPLDTAPEKLRKKYNNLKAEWRKRTDRGSVVLDREPRWFSLLNHIFMAATEPSNVTLNPNTPNFSADHKRRSRGYKRNSEAKTTKMERDSPIVQDVVESREKSRTHEIDLDAHARSCSSSSHVTSSHRFHNSRTTEEEQGIARRNKSFAWKRRTKYGRSVSSPHRIRKVGTSSTIDINHLANGVQDLATSLLEIKQISIESERRRDEMFLKFFADEAERNRAHELRLAEIYSKSDSGPSVTQANPFPKPRRRSMLLNYITGKRTVPSTITSNRDDIVIEFPNPDLTIDNLYPTPQDNDES